MCLYPVTLYSKPERIPHTVSCGKCLECLRASCNEWAFRILDECTLHTDNCFITLTYNDENLPFDCNVSKREHQLFMKSLRKAISPVRIRFFVSGEYGKRYGRPHYHYCIFGWKPDDMTFWQVDRKGVKLYRSAFLESIWTKGFSTVGFVTYDSALYIAKYLQKAQFLDTPPQRLIEYEDTYSFVDVKRPFVFMSNRPGIGYGAVYNHKNMLSTDRIYKDGHFVKVPRYYLKVMERDGVYLDDLKVIRRLRGEQVEASLSREQLLVRRRKAVEFLSSKKYPT